MANKHCRLRKYRRKKLRAIGTKAHKFDRLAKLYWRYHFQVYGPHVDLWRIATD